MSRSAVRALWGVGGVVFLGVAAVAASVSAWAGVVAALMLATVQVVIAVRLSVNRQPPHQA